ncbi:MAG: TonB-dependent receptor [Bacteroidales bacterium]|nr:TonB-dependent receptor [Bacteroidales bacterium]
MKPMIPILFFLMPFFYPIEAQNMQVTQRLTFKEFVKAVEAKQKIRFFYKDEWIKDLTPVNYSDTIKLTDVLDNLFRGTSVRYYKDRFGNIVLTKFYEVKVSDKPVKQETNYIPPTDYGDSGEYKLTSGNQLTEVGNPAERNLPGNATVSGYVSDRDTKYPVAGVTVFVQKLMSGTVTNEFGFYSLNLPRGLHNIQFSFVGMREKSLSLNLNGTGEMNVEMNSMLIPLKETIVSAQKNMTLQRFEVGAERINITTFRLLPTSMGESDIIKSVLLVPGVQSVGEGSAGFNVRGGSADQNLILLYGAPVYNSSHFFGFFSAVNSDIIKDVTLYKGGIPGRYGGRISSVLDIESVDGNKKETKGNIGISPITTHFMVEGPVIRDTLSYVITGRTTYSNWIFSLIQNPALQRSRASFYDLNTKVTYDLNKKNKFDFSSYVSHDSFRFSSDSVYKYDNKIFALKWRHFFSTRLFMSLSVNNSNYRYNISSQELTPESFSLSHRINSTGFKADFNWFLKTHELNFGTETNRYNVLPGSYLPPNDSSIVVPWSLDRENAWDAALYIDDKISLTDFLSVSAGVRLSSFFAIGPSKVLNYTPGFQRSRSSITDTLYFGKNEVSGKYAGPELRLSLNFRISGNSSLKVNYNRTRQYLHLLSNSTSISPTDTWKLSDYYLKPQVGDQVGLGIYQMLLNSGIETSAELYFKKLTDMVDFKGGTDLVMNENIIEDIVNVNGRAYGLELMFKKSEGKFRYSLGYTYSRTFIRSRSNYSDEIINNGKWFPSNFDKPNDLVATFNYLLSRRFSFSTNYTYSTGRPITFPVATYIMYENILVHYSERNRYRLPDYSRLDLSIKVSGNLKLKRLGRPNWTFSVYNLLGRQNVYSIYFMKDGDIYKGYKLSVFGQAIPSVTFNYEF